MQIKGIKILSVYEILRLYNHYPILRKLQEHDHQGVHLIKDSQQQLNSNAQLLAN